jgi:hypothetical protein
LQLVRRFPVFALLCSLAVLLCELVSRPYTTMGVGDDGPYILMAQTLAKTGHLAYNGWEAAMIASQLYLAEALIHFFGFSFTIVRSSTLLIAMSLAFLLQRALVRASISERNATLGTLAFVLSPLYLMLSVTFMSDITGLFAIVVCLYGCLRALQASTQRSVILWLFFAVTANVVFGTSRQIAWLGTLVMVPSTLCLLRAPRRVLLAGVAFNLAGIFAIFACMQWLKRQPYVIPVPLFVANFPWRQAFAQLGYLLWDIPFLLLPIFALFLPQVRKSRSRLAAVLSTFFLAFLFLATYPSHLRGYFSRWLEPATGGLGSWITPHGMIEVFVIPGRPPMYLSPSIQVVLTVASIGGLLGVLLLLRHRSLATASPSAPPTQLAALLGPFFAAYLLLLWAAAGSNSLYDRYALGLMVVVLPCLLRLYQDHVQRKLPAFSIFLIAIMAAYGICQTHNNFALDRARVALARELNASGVSDTSLDASWESNLDVELHYADHINDPRIKNGYIPTPPPAGLCQMSWYDKTPHIHALYGVSFDPNACYGPAPFAPVHYSRWPHFTPGTLYVVRYTPAVKP